MDKIAKLQRRLVKVKAEIEELNEQQEELKRRIHCKLQFIEGLEAENEALRLLIKEMEADDV